MMNRFERSQPDEEAVIEFLDGDYTVVRPGSFVRLLDQPHDLPPFQLIHCRGGRCWVRQQSWGNLVQWEVAHQQLSTGA